MGRRLLPYLVASVVGATAAVALLGFLPASRGEVGPGTVEVRTRWAIEPRTALVIPPLGQISAPTHDSPVAFEARIEEVDVERAGELARSDRPAEVLQAEVQDALRPLLWGAAVRAVLLAAVVGAAAAALLPGRRWSFLPVGGLSAAITVSALLGLAAATFDPLAFEEPDFEGPISAAPKLIETARRHVADFEEARSRIDVLGAQVSDLYAASVTEGIAGQPDEVRILQVSDIHLNPVGVELAIELAEQFDVDAVVDTGDLTSFGVPFEARIGELIEEIDVPYYVVPGNHDSPANRRALGRFDGVTVLDGEVADIEGIEVLGVADPNFTATNELDEEAIAENLADQHPEVERLVARHDPDVLAVHNRRQADTVLGTVPLVIAGHLHEHTFAVADGTILTTAGSTGATGLGSFTVDTDLPYEASVLRFVDGQLTIVDTVALRGTGGEFHLDRRLVGDEAVQEP